MVNLRRKISDKKIERCFDESMSSLSSNDDLESSKHHSFNFLLKCFTKHFVIQHLIKINNKNSKCLAQLLKSCLNYCVNSHIFEANSKHPVYFHQNNPWPLNRKSIPEH